MRPADFGARLSAWTIDAALLFALQWIVVIVAARQLQAAGMTARSVCETDPAFVCEGPSTALWVVLFGFVVVSTFGYHVWFDGVRGATPGKRWMGLCVVGRDAADASPVGWERGLLRAAVRQGVWIWVFLFLGASPIAIEVASPIYFATLALSLTTFVLGAYAPSGRALHDRAAATAVVLGGSLAPVPREPVSVRSEPAQPSTFTEVTS